MAKSQLMVQVRLEKQLADGGTSWQVSWIPIKFAKTGMVVKLKKGEDWDDGWVVTQGGSGGVVRTAKECAERANDYKKHRKRTDI